MKAHVHSLVFVNSNSKDDSPYFNSQAFPTLPGLLALQGKHKGCPYGVAGCC